MTSFGIYLREQCLVSPIIISRDKVWRNKVELGSFHTQVTWSSLFEKETLAESI
jgi:hypothetical protein